MLAIFQIEYKRKPKCVLVEVRNLKHNNIPKKKCKYNSWRNQQIKMCTEVLK